MPRIKCHYDDCVFLEDGYCGAAAVELEPDSGCLTYQRDAEAEPEETWDEEDFEDEIEEEEDLYEDEEEDDDAWDEDDDDRERY